MNQPSHIRVAVATLILATGACMVALAAPRPEINTSRGQFALRGYDAVAYWTDGRPVKGSPAYEYRWRDAVWRFSTAAARDRFAQEPDRYAPQFGGYCAYAVSRGYTADGDPTVWRIVGGRLYLNYSRQAERLWQQDIPGNIAKAERNWPEVLGQ